MNGILLIDKDAGMTSHDVVHKLRKILGIKEIGHAGTLDPMATGLLVCLLGSATKLSQYVMAEEKSYRVGILLGRTTDTGDFTGQTISEKAIDNLDLQQVLSEARALKGELRLVVPKYSAVKISGKKLYEYARGNLDVELPTKTMFVKTVVVGDQPSLDNLMVDIECGKGTYIRSWAEKLGEILCVGATVKSLRRLSTGPFLLERAVTLKALSDLAGGAGLGGSPGALPEIFKDQSFFVPGRKVLDHWPALKVAGRDEVLVRHGQIPHGILAQSRIFEIKQGLRVLNSQGGLVALLVKDAEKGIKIGRVFKD